MRESLKEALDTPGEVNTAPNTATGMRTVLQSFQPSVCLGDATAFQLQRTQLQQRDQPAEDVGGRMGLLEPGSIPQAVWDASRLLGPRGTLLLRLCVELQHDR
jgi:hypothetical protein